MVELPLKTREFLARLRPEDLDTLEDGVKLVNAFRTLGRGARGVIISLGGLALAVLAVWEGIQKLVG